MITTRIISYSLKSFLQNFFKIQKNGIKSAFGDSPVLYEQHFLCVAEMAHNCMPDMMIPALEEKMSKIWHSDIKRLCDVYFFDKKRILYYYNNKAILWVFLLPKRLTIYYSGIV